MPLTTGRLSQGMSQAIGLVLGYLFRQSWLPPRRTDVLVSDGELQVGQTWEAFLSAAHLNLHGLVVVLDLNDSQVDARRAR